MITRRRLSVIAVLCLLLHPTQASAQDNLWETCIKAGMQSYRQGKYAEAEVQFLAALKEAENFDPEDPRLDRSLNFLVELYLAQGMDAEVEPHLKRSLEIKEKILGPEHADVAAGLNQLAELYRAQDKFAEAEPLYRRALGIIVINLGPEHLMVAISLDNYAALLRELNREEEAEKMFARANAIRLNVTRGEHAP